MRVLVTGSRHWTDWRAIFVDLDLVRHISLYDGGPVTVIHGAAMGADTCAAQASERLGYNVWSFPAEWDRLGKSAGPIRNREMLDMRPDIVLAYPMPDSRGTWDCVNEARRRGIPVAFGARPALRVETAQMRAASAALDGLLEGVG